MRKELARVQNLLQLSSAYFSLSDTANLGLGIPVMGLVSGGTGSGKTRSIKWLIEQPKVNGVFLRANAAWTLNSMLGAIATDLGISPQWRNAKTLKSVCEWFESTRRPLFIDECDYLLRDLRMLETLRDIHDMAGIPVILVGMSGIEKKLAHRQQLSRRISQFVEFQPLDMQDARILADTVCDVGVSDDLLSKIHKESQGGMGLMIVALARVEMFAKTQQWETVNASQWGQHKKFFLSAKAG
jgi:DNA transposition AAA+ family ATPase